MVAQDPQVAGLRDRVVGRFGDHIRVRLDPAVHCAELRQLPVVESKRRQLGDAVAQVTQGFELDLQQAAVPLRELRRAVVGEAVRADLLGRELLRDVHRNFVEGELLGCLVAGVPAHDDPVPVHHDRLAEPEVADRLRHRVHRRIIVAGVGLVGVDRVDRLHFNFHS